MDFSVPQTVQRRVKVAQTKQSSPPALGATRSERCVFVNPKRQSPSPSTGSPFAPSRFRICMPVTRSPGKLARARGGKRCKGLPSPLPFAAAAAATRENFPAGSALVSRTLFSLLQHTGACSPKEGVVQPGWGWGGKGKKLMAWRGGRGWKSDKEARTDHLFAFSSRLAPKAIIIIINDPRAVESGFVLSFSLRKRKAFAKQFSLGPKHGVRFLSVLASSPRNGSRS